MTKPTESQVLSASIEALAAKPGKPASAEGVAKFLETDQAATFINVQGGSRQRSGGLCYRFYRCSRCPAALAKALADSGSEFDGMNAALKTELGKRLFGLMNSQSISGTGRVSVNPLDGPALVGLLEPSLQTCRGSRSA